MRRDTAVWLSVLVLVTLACQPGASAPSAPRGDGASVATTQAPVSAVAAPVTPVAAPPALRKLDLPLAAISASLAPIWVAVDYGLFLRHGLEVEANGMSPASASQALTAGSSPVGVTGGSTVTAWLGGSTELVFIAGLTNTALFEIIGRPEIASLDDLRGKAAGSTSAGSGATMAMYETLRRNGIEPERDVTISYLRDQPGVLTGLVTGAVQGAVLSSPFTELARGQGMRPLLDMRELAIPLVALNITSTRGQLERDPDLLRSFLMGYIEGLQYTRDYPAETVESIVRGTRTDNRADAESGYRLYNPDWSPWPSEAAIQTVLNNLDVPGATTARPAELIDDRLLRDLERSGWLAEHYRGS
jgi:ABC-type nitrate/sulfonate/bicarbonate transport system substrate-binding protein